MPYCRLLPQPAAIKRGTQDAEYLRTGKAASTIRLITLLIQEIRYLVRAITFMDCHIIDHL